MNERVRKYFISAMALCCSLLLVFPFCICDVLADESVQNQNDLTFIVNPVSYSKQVYNAQNPFVRFRFGIPNDMSSMVGQPPIFAVVYKVANQDGSYNYGDSSWNTLFFSTESLPNNGTNILRVDYSPDNINWTGSGFIGITTSYKASSGNATQLYYINLGYNTSITQFAHYVGAYMPNECPRVYLNYGQSATTILGVFSSGDFSYLPWNFSTSSGGMHFSDGNTLNPENTSKYSQIFIVMDQDETNTVTEAELFYYNSTYNTNYDYSEINNGDSFTEMQFLNWVALQIANGNDDPGGGTGSGGGSTVGGGGITIGDNSFTQSQNQTIEENAVNVTVNNNNSLSQENVQTLENFIELNLGEQQENAFAEAVGGISRFIGVGQAFAGLVTAVLGFLPAWTITLLGVLFTIIFVMIVFRLLHVFL